MSNDQSQGRPRPQFGEYATPEEQRAAIREPGNPEGEPVPVADDSETSSTHGKHRPTDAGERRPGQDSASRASSPAQQTTPARPKSDEAPPTPGSFDDEMQRARLRTDKLATYLLLAVGLFSVLTTIPSLTQLPNSLSVVYAQFGVDEPGNPGMASVVGWVILIVQAVLWVAALVLSRRRLARERKAWWIPLVIGVVANLFYIVGIAVVMLNDPSFLDYATQVSQGL